MYHGHQAAAMPAITRRVGTGVMLPRANGPSTAAMGGARPQAQMLRTTQAMQGPPASYPLGEPWRTQEGLFWTFM